MDTWCLLLLGILCCLNGVQTLTCPSGFQSTILGTCADTNECQGSAPCTKGTCVNTNGNHYCDDSQSIDKNNQTVCGSVTCNNFANCVNNTNTCICQPGYTGPTCSVQLSCDKMCRNNGTCDFQGIEEVCICSEGFTGSECQYSLNICNNQSQSVCLNNGTCAFGQFDSFPSCSCSGSYEGLFCEASNCSTLCYPSNKDASCGGSCLCNSTYYGDSCQYTTCTCENGGVSVPDDVASCRCVCPEGTSGANCSVSTVNECRSSPCQNGGTCMDEIGYYTCKCPPEYSGYNCDKRCELDRNCLWKDCMQCKNKFGDGVCDSECNNELCLFDGFDCYNGSASVCNGTYPNGTKVMDLPDKCMGLYDDNICVSNETTAEVLCRNQACGSDGLDCLDNKRSSSNIIGVLVVDFILKNNGITDEAVLNDSTPTLFGKLLPYSLSSYQGFPAFFVRRQTTDSFSPGTGSMMVNPYPDFFTSLKYRVYYNVANQPNCSSSSSFPCWTDITSVSRYVALTATSLLSTYIDSFTELFTCTEGYYGSRCAMNCSSMCQSNSAGRTCEMDTGKCISGCSSNSYTGDNCDIMCASNCLGSCSNTDGVCALTSNNTRCKAGYQGFYCNETCSSITYGIDCAFNCSTNCKTGTCNTMTGYCTCKPGYSQTDPMCRTACSSGTYGDNCTGVCNPCGAGSPCNTVDGSCSSCPVGKQGSLCNQAATLADPTSDMQSTIIAAIIIIVCLLAIAGIIAFILWRRNQGSEYQLNEVEPLSTKKLNGENGNAFEMQEKIDTTATLENEKRPEAEDTPLLEQTDKVYTGDAAQTNPTESSKSDRSSSSSSTESTKNNDAGDSDAINNGGILKLDFKYIDVESKENSLEDVRDTGKEESTAETVGEGNVTGDVNTGTASEGETAGKTMETGRSNSYLETDIDTAHKNGE
uniref:Uncharacterized protein n=1 Tax=Magallana gigas TaxID=29159 RepID=A0A8W8NHW5_MAGGI